MRSPLHSIRWRIQAWHGLLLFIALTGLGVTAYQLQRGGEFRRLEDQIHTRLSALHASLQRPPVGQPPPPDHFDGGPPDRFPERPGENPGGDFPPPPPPGGFNLARESSGLFGADTGGFYYRIWSRTGEIFGESKNVPAGLTEPARIMGPAHHRIRNGMREIFEFTPMGECLLVGAPETAVWRELAHFAGWLLGLGGAVLVLGLAGGWWLASRAIAPIDAISAAASRIADGRMNERIDVNETESELGRLAAVLNSTFERLEAVFAEQARFTSDAAHELRTPISVILAQTQLALKRPRGAESYRETIETVQRSALRMQGLIESLLELARLGPDAALDLRPCNLEVIAREQLEHIRPLADQRGIVLSDELVSAPCSADAGRIAQVVTNLLTNAVKYSRPGDKVRVKTKLENGSAKLSVTDTGPGISAKHLPHLFERFYRADLSRNRATGGAGLGLAICKSIAEAHGGTLKVATVEGRGSKFTLRIPTGDAVAVQSNAAEGNTALTVSQVFSGSEESCRGV